MSSTSQRLVLGHAQPAFSPGEKVSRAGPNLLVDDRLISRFVAGLDPVDARVLTATRRDDPVLPRWLAPGFVQVLRPAWVRTGGGMGAKRLPAGVAGSPEGQTRHDFADNLGERSDNLGQGTHDDSH